MSDPTVFPPPVSPPPGAPEPDDLAADLAALARIQRRHTRARAAIGAGLVLIGAALAWPVLVAVPARVLATLALLGLAVAGAVWLVSAAYGWWSGRYEVARPHPWIWRWRIVRRWYAPGATVWRADPAPWDGPLTVLGWHADPACATGWALVYDGTPRMSGGAAQWLPLDQLAPTPAGPPTGAAGSGESGEFGLMA
ncbi:hypothetical protein ETD83_39675 [Actinomadura soli]|uniref:Uncharacterized protein n=1 Tax=Actinomadura soli TaxID=2508997 RepID=A0A5C4J0C9_9ACTN|nr:hypothetical protein [Actinomadura soli]TMQ87879.1 hypothetical protein ETD83_39675 [Actinomadura soli]